MKQYTKENRKQEKSKSLFSAAGILILMLAPGYLIDLLYAKRNEYLWIKALIEHLYHFWSPLGITYHSVWAIISGEVGIIITLVSLLLSTTMSFEQRTEKILFGITYKELQDCDQSKWVKSAEWTKRMSLVAPLVLMIVLNETLSIPQQSWGD